MTDLLLDARNLSVGFRGEKGIARVLNDVNLSMKKGQIMGLVGESGCGKTTLARAILGVLPKNTLVVESGSISFRGIDMLTPENGVAQDAVRGTAITFIPQDPFTSLNPVFTIGEQIDDLMKWKSPNRETGWHQRIPSLLAPYPAKQRKLDKEAIMEALNAVQLPQPERLMKKYPHEVSGGQRQRIMIAMALLPKPDLIIADEPTTALDVTIQAQILGVLRKLANDRGVAVLLTTHDLGAAYEICDGITVMYAGQEVEAAPTDSFFNDPAHPYTNKLLASRPDGGGGMVGIPGELPSFFSPPPGCRFAPRCERVTDACKVRPPVALRSSSHILRCHHPLEAPLSSGAKLETRV